MAAGTTHLPEPWPLRLASPSANRPLPPLTESVPWQQPRPASAMAGSRPPRFPHPLPSGWPADLVVFMISVVPHSLPLLPSFRSVAHRLPFQRRRSGTPHTKPPAASPYLTTAIGVRQEAAAAMARGRAQKVSRGSIALAHPPQLDAARPLICYLPCLLLLS